MFTVVAFTRTPVTLAAIDTPPPHSAENVPAIAVSDWLVMSHSKLAQAAFDGRSCGEIHEPTRAPAELPAELPAEAAVGAVGDTDSRLESSCTHAADSIDAAAMIEIT
jgi:hypothetical protein